MKQQSKIERRYSTLGPATFEEAKERLKAKRKGKKAAPRYGLARRPAKRKQTRLKSRPDRRLQVWSKKVRERDDYTCQMTGIRDVKRNIAHHVAPRSRRPDLRLNVSNGITLTREAHQRVHDNPIWATEHGWLSDSTYEAARKEAA